MDSKLVAELLLQMIEDFISEKKREGKNPSLKLMMDELKQQMKK